MAPQSTELSTIENFILLDLLGAPNPSMRSFFLDTAWLYDEFLYAEKRLGESGALAYDDEQDMAPGQWRSWFAPRSEHQKNMGGMGDDHVPFLARGVSILHLIPLPFPGVWHKLSVRRGQFVSLLFSDIDSGRRIRTPSPNYATVEPHPARRHVGIPQPSPLGPCRSGRRIVRQVERGARA